MHRRRGGVQRALPGALARKIWRGHVSDFSRAQAHLFEAQQLERACLEFIKANMEQVVVTPGFVSLSHEWPAVMVKINLHTAGVAGERASEVIEQAESQKRKRGDDGATAEGQKA